MDRKDFMKELEYLLQDISEEEKADALSYYADYLEEAGTDNEEQVLREFGSPERIAAMIRADLADNLKEGGSFTERGFEDERFSEIKFDSPRLEEIIVQFKPALVIFDPLQSFIPPEIQMEQRNAMKS